MSAYIKLSTLEYPRYEGDIRLEYPHILNSQTGDTFPCPPTYALVEPVDPPECDPVTEILEEAFPECVEGKWRRVWRKRPATQEEIDFATNAIKRSLTDTTSPGTAPDVIG